MLITRLKRHVRTGPHLAKYAVSVEKAQFLAARILSSIILFTRTDTDTAFVASLRLLAERISGVLPAILFSVLPRRYLHGRRTYREQSSQRLSFCSVP